MYLIDTNIFLEVLLSRSRKAESKELLGSLRTGKNNGIVTDFAIHSIILAMDGLKRLNELKIFLSSLIAYRGLHMYSTTIADEARAVDLALEKNLDMDDAIQYSSALSAKADTIVSFDKYFDHLEIPRVEPPLER